MGRPLASRRSAARALLLVISVVLVGSWLAADGGPGGGQVRTTQERAGPPAERTTTSVAERRAAPTVRPRRKVNAAELAPSAVTASTGAAVAPTDETTTTTAAPTTSTTVAPAPPTDAIVARPIPSGPPPAPPAGPAPPWAAGTTVTPAGYVATPAGCASGTSAGALDAFFRDRMGPVIGHDYQHVYDLGGGRHLWLFQDTFIDHAGTATRLDQAAFAHNAAMVQDGTCFTLLHRGSVAAPSSFEPGPAERTLSRWYWPLGGEAVDGRLFVFWVEMSKTADPQAPDGLGWIPVGTWLATYRTSDLSRLSFGPAPASGVTPIYGYAVSSDATHSYLFGNSFDQNLARQGGYWACPCSATTMWLARVPRGQLAAPPEFWSGSGWSGRQSDARPISGRFHAENPMQPRYLGGQWVATTKVDGYWGEELVIDVAADPWGPWTTVLRRPLAPRGGDPLMNTYHAHLLPWLEGGTLVISVSQNARDMGRHAFPHPERYRLQLLSSALVPPPPPPTTTTTSTTTTSTTTTTVPESTSTSTTTSTTTTTTTSTSTTSTTSTTTSSTAPASSAPAG